MADKSISQLTAASTLYDNDLMVLEQNGIAKKMEGSVLKNYVVGQGGIVSIVQNADYTLTVTYTSGVTWTSGNIRGLKGDQGNGIVSVTKISTSGNIDTYRITYDNGNTSTFTITNGANASVVATRYQASSSGTTPPTGTWQTSVPTVTGGNYLWTRFEWNNGTYSYVTSRYGIDGSGSVQSVDGVSPNSSGNVALGAERTANKSTSIGSSSTDTQYPSAKAVYNYAGAKVKTASVTLNTTWTASGDNYTKTVTISGVTANSKIDVQPDAAVIAQLVNDGVTALYFTNNNGTVSAVAVGAKPTASMTVQVTITEVTA